MADRDENLFTWSKSKTITISEESYYRLVSDQRFLRCLEECGVDNWEGYSEAWNLYHKWDADTKEGE